MKDLIITKSKLFDDDKLYNEFHKKAEKLIKFPVEIHFETLNNSITKEKLPLISVWYSFNLYGNRYVIREKEISVGYVDSLKDKIIKIDGNIIDLIIQDITENHIWEK